MKRGALILLALLTLVAPWRAPAGTLPLGGAFTMILNVKDYPDFQTALDALENQGGGILEIPPGTYTPTTVPSFSGVVLPQNCIMRGAGKNASILQETDPSVTLVTLRSYSTTATGGSAIQDLGLRGPGTSGVGCGLNTSNSGKWVSNLFLRNVDILYTGSWGIFMDLDAQFIDQCIFEDVSIAGNQTNGAMYIGRGGGGGANVVTFLKCQFNGSAYNNKYGPDSLYRGVVHISQSTDLNFIGCSFQGDSSVAVSVGSVSRNLNFIGCHFELGSQSTTKKHWFTVDAPTGMTNLLVQSCTFQRFTATLGYQLLKVGNNSGASGTLFDNCFIYTAGTPASDDIDMGTSGNGDVRLRNCIYSGAEILIANATAKSTTGSVYVKGTSGAPLTGTWSAGDVIVSTVVDTVYFCQAGGTPGTWRRVAVTTP